MFVFEREKSYRQNQENKHGERYIFVSLFISEQNFRKKYPQNHPINESQFNLEQNYIKPYTKEELKEMEELDRRMTKAVMGIGFRALNENLDELDEKI